MCANLIRWNICRSVKDTITGAKDDTWKSLKIMIMMISALRYDDCERKQHKKLPTD